MTYSKMSDEEIQKTMNRICSRCGEYFARHSGGANECPVINHHGRTIGYKPSPNYFKEWEEDCVDKPIS